MDDIVITIRHASSSDADEIADVHDAAWRSAYRGIIPGRELERMIARRGPAWWRSAIARRSGLLVLEFDECIVGYVSYGKNRLPAIPFGGEIFELYLLPECQGVGFGRRLFNAARRDLVAHGYAGSVVWALADNQPALDFYTRLGGVEIRRAEERFGPDVRERIAFGFA
ncbi:MAG: family N-acetyltransferase [Hyphomicrobiales bacterium]|nr:family N-acetyltransferase [Hyphomicrobiales bacterium]